MLRLRDRLSRRWCGRYCISFSGSLERGERDEFCGQVGSILLRVHPKGLTGESSKLCFLFFGVNPTIYHVLYENTPLKLCCGDPQQSMPSASTGVALAIHATSGDGGSCSFKISRRPVLLPRYLACRRVLIRSLWPRHHMYDIMYTIMFHGRCNIPLKPRYLAAAPAPPR